ncbi:TauD/TfdA dioxygenase family protein [Streptomyces sp. NPDC002602]|uniref:TauD/TfdA dioxygenase family protein n=1 Tax=Streptomyces sp. NPDC002602 TaxID=3364654 RepID=UPI0036B3EB91
MDIHGTVGDLTVRHQAGPRALRRLPEGEQSRPYELFGIEPVTGLIGAEVSGVDLREPVGPALFAELDRALLEWKVLFFRDQHITAGQHLDFARRWGELEVNPFFPHEVPELGRIEASAQTPGGQNVWHADGTWREKPLLGAVLRAVEVPEAGGDTCFADMGAAYDGLPAEVKFRIHELSAFHDFAPSIGLGMEADKLAELRVKYPAVEHPVVRCHPRTGRRTLFVNPGFTTHITGMGARESEALLGFLFHQAAVPEFQVRFRWEADSIALWDNQATQHYAVNDYFPQHRLMERVAILDEHPRAGKWPAQEAGSARFP